MSRLSDWGEEIKKRAPVIAGFRRTVSVRLRPAQLKMLDDLAGKFGITKTAVAEQVLENALCDVTEYLEANP